MPISDFKPTNSHLKEDGQSFELQPLINQKARNKGTLYSDQSPQKFLKIT